jgi:signal transduction histidine kinase
MGFEAQLIQGSPSSCPDVAAALRTATADLLRNWRHEVLHALPNADRLTRDQFDDGIPKILDDIAEALECGDSHSLKTLVEDSPEHGAVRYHQKFNLNEMLIEYALLRRVLIEEVTRVLDRPLTATESTAVHGEIDVAMRQSTVSFSNHQASQLTNEANVMAKYLSFLSHDLRGGLNGSILMIEVLRRELMNDPKYAEAVSDLDMMRRSMFDTVATMDRFLHAERLRRGKMPVRITQVDLHALLHKLVRNVHHQMLDRNISATLEVNLDGPIPTDSDVLAIVLQNLIGNALKYCGGKPIRVEAKRMTNVPSLDGKPDCVRISVEDHGPGMSQETIEHLFQPFERGETYGQNGVGLGMTIARQAADLLGARLSVDSVLDRGTTFHLDL